MAVFTLGLGLAPVAAFAHGNGIHVDGNSHIAIALGHFREHRSTINGSVTASGSSQLTVKAKNGTVYTVAVDASTKLVKPFNVPIVFGDIHVNDNVQVKGVITGTSVAAASIVVTPANTHVAAGKGMVTAVSGNTVTLQTTNHGIVSNVTVKTDANTQVTKSDGSVGATSDVTVGSQIKVKGLWDELLNVLNAIKIKIR